MEKLQLAASVGNRAPAVVSQAGAGAPASASGASNEHSGSRFFLCERRRSSRTHARDARAAPKSIDDFATFAPGPKGLQRLRQDVGRLFVGAALLDVGQVRLVGLDLRWWRWIRAVEVGW
jgi:hypothetical protein